MSESASIPEFQTTSPGASAAIAIPARYWWLRRILVGTGVAVLCLIGLRLTWGHLAYQRLQHEVERIRAAGEPILPEDFITEEPPHESNGGPLILEALGRIELVPQADVLRGKQVWTPQEIEDARAALAASAEGLALLDTALGRPQVVWPPNPPTTKQLIVPPYLMDLRFGGRNLQMFSRYHHQLGDHAGSIEAFRRTRLYLRAFGEEPGLIPFQNINWLESNYARQVEFVAPTLCIGPDCRDPKVRPASREGVLVLIAQLLDEQWFRAAMVRMVFYEQAYHFNSLVELAHGETCVQTTAGMGMPGALPSDWERALLYPLIPMVYDRGTELLRVRMDVCVLEGLEHWQTFSRYYMRPDLSTWEETLAKFPGTYGNLFKTFCEVFHMSLDSAMQFYFRTLAVRRLAAVRLAIRLFEIDRGKLPEQLDDLVPTYLAAIPLDPFGGPGECLRFKPEVDGGVIYSLGINGEDDGGRSDIWWRKWDIVIRLQPIDDEQ